MQFLEHSSVGVRSAIYELDHPTAALRFLLVPMVHVAEPRFYEAVARRVGSCTAAVLEGVAGRQVHYITLVYYLLGRFHRLGLCEQSYPQLLAFFTGQIIHGDVSEEAFTVSWHNIPLYFRAVVLIMVPFIALKSLLVGSREVFAQGMEVTDLPDRDDILESAAETEAEMAFDKAIGNDRDEHLRQVLTAYFAANAKNAGLVAVIYGAAHMPAIWQFLRSLGYHVRSASWETVLSFDA